MKNNFSMASDLRFEITIREDETRETVAQALCKNADAADDFLGKQIEILGIDKDGKNEEGKTYTVFTAEYNVKTKEYMFTRSVIFKLNKPRDGKHPSMPFICSFNSANIYDEKDITGTVTLTKKRGAVVDKITRSLYQNMGVYGEFFTIYFKDGKTKECTYKKEFDNAIDEYIKDAFWSD